MSLRDKVAVVVGGGIGIGRAIAMLFAAEGARVAVFGRREPLLVDTVAAIRKAGGTALLGAGVSQFRQRMLEHRIPIGRAGHVDDVAHACPYLASDTSRYLAGSVLAVDGGWIAS